VKKCTNCAKDIPDTAFHCVFCGAKQGAPQAAGPAQKTIMGYSAADLQKFMPQAGQQPPAGQPGGFAPSAGADQRTMMVGAGGGPVPPAGSAADQRTMMAGVGGAPLPPPGQGQGGPARTMMAGPGGAPYPPGLAPGDQRTMLAGMGGAPIQPMTPMQPPQQYQPQPQQYQPQPQQYQPQPQQYQPQPQQYQPPQPQYQAPVGQRPQYLASQSAARELSPSEPWAGSLRAMMIVFGIALLVSFAAPMAFGDGGMQFMWKQLTAGGGFTTAKLWPLIIGVSGLVTLLFGVLPVPTAARGVVAALVGVGAVVAGLTAGGLGAGGSPAGGGWQAYATVGGLVLGATGLLVRSKYRGAMLGRLLATIGCGAILAAMLVPVGGSIPLINMIKQLGGGGGLGFPTLIGLLVVLVAALGLIMSWMPSSTGAGTGFFAWVLILAPFLLMLCMLIVQPLIDSEPIGNIVKQPGRLYMAVDVLAYAALSAFGLATIFGKSLEA
jgi:hypothetical protein